MAISIDKTYFNILCIDKRFDFLTTEYFQAVGFSDNYYLGTTVGSGLVFRYKEYCSEICNCNYNCTHNGLSSITSTSTYDPFNSDIQLLKDSLVKNIEIALTLDPM